MMTCSGADWKCARTDMAWKKLFTGVFWNVCRVKTKYWELTADCITRWSYRFEDREVDNLCCLWDVCKPRSRHI